METSGAVAAVEQRKVLKGALAVAGCAVLVIFLWQFLQVRFLYQDDWSSLFYTGADWPYPDTVANEHVYRFPNVYGYDARFYHLIAHDLFFKRGYVKYMDFPRHRYRRILVPGLAAILAFGQDKWIDNAYRFVILGFTFLGTYWFARLSAGRGRSVLWGLLFAITPATLVSMTTMVVDVAVAALAVGAIWYAEQDEHVSLFVVVSCAALTRETGFLVLAAWLLWLVYKLRFRSALLYSLAALPAVGWWTYVQLHAGPAAPPWLYPIPFAGIIHTFAHPFAYTGVPFRGLLIALDRLALLGMVIALGFVFRDLFRMQFWSFPNFIAFAFTGLAAFLYFEEFWPEVAGFGRTFTPLVSVVMLSGLATRNWWKLVPLGLILPRIVIVMAVHLGQIVQHALHRS